MAKHTNGAPGIAGVTFAAIESAGVDAFLAPRQDELVHGTSHPTGYRRQAIPQDTGQGERVLSIPALRDRVVPGALKRILEPLFAAAFQAGAYGYRPGRSAHEAVERVAEALVQDKTRVLDIDLHAYCDNLRQDVLVATVAQRVKDPDVRHGLKLLLKATGKQGVAQGDVLAPRLSNLSLSEVDRMLERAKAVTRRGHYTSLEYARFADDLVILIDAYPQPDGLLRVVAKRLREELAILQVTLNEAKSRIVDLAKGERCGVLGFAFRRVRTHPGKWRAH
jgi:RNA-directed DNA polymerase